MNTKHLIAVFCALVVAGTVYAESRPEEIIKSRQAAYAFLGWNSAKIRAALDPSGTFNKEDVIKSANAIQAIANSGLGALYVKGTDQGTGFHETKLKAEAFDPAYASKLAEVAGNFNKEANTLAVVAATGNKEAIKDQYSKLSATCKGCHDNFRAKNN
ncbi:c-type cytochrome [Aquirhabdus sp.]|uniref:c-type cytochrome n=1 Tax=Aquirhabdus sp. TaxID=2824160 RepID=UPI00396CAF8D